MRGLTGILMLLGLCLAPALARAAPVDPALQATAMAIYDQWNKAIAAGKLKEATALRSARMRAQIAAEAKTAAAQKRLLGMLKDMAPETVEVQHARLSRDGAKLEIVTIIAKTMPKGVKTPGAPPAGTKLRNELTLEFVREDGAWKFDNQTWGMDPGKVKPCASTAFDGMASFDDGRDMSMGGQIRRVAFNADHTLVVIRMFDEENCIFLPAKARLAELGMDPDVLEPWAIIEIKAWPHRTDPQRVWAEALKVLEQE